MTESSDPIVDAAECLFSAVLQRDSTAIKAVTSVIPDPAWPTPEYAAFARASKAVADTGKPFDPNDLLSHLEGGMTAPGAFLSRLQTVTPACNIPGRVADIMNAYRDRVMAERTEGLEKALRDCRVKRDWEGLNYLLADFDLSESGDIESKLRYADLSDIAKYANTRPEWAFHDAIPCGAMSLLSSPTGVGKTMVALGLSECVVMGEPVFRSLVPTRAGHVLYLSGEDGVAEIGRRLYRLIVANGLDFQTAQAAIAERFHLIADHTEPFLECRAGALVRTEFYNRVLRAARDVRPLLIVVDHARKFSGALEENSNGVIGRFVDCLVTLAQTSGAAVLTLAHTGKAAREDRYAARGASALSDESRASWVLREVENQPGIVEMVNAKQSFARQHEPLTLAFDGGAMRETTPIKHDVRELIPAILQWLDGHPDKIVTQGGILKGDGPGAALAKDMVIDHAWATRKQVARAAELGIGDGTISTKARQRGNRQKVQALCIPEKVA